MTKKTLFVILFLCSLALFPQENDSQTKEIQPVNQATADMVNLLQENLGQEESPWWSAFLTVDRRLYLPLNRRSLAYQPGEILLDNGERRTSPAVLFSLFQLLETEQEDRILVAGNYGAYEASLLHQAGREVYLIQRDEEILDLRDFATIQGRRPYVQWQPESPFQGIFLTTPQKEISPETLNQLDEGSFLIAKLRIPGGWDQWIRIQRIGFSYRVELLSSEGTREAE